MLWLNLNTVHIVQFQPRINDMAIFVSSIKLKNILLLKQIEQAFDLFAFCKMLAKVLIAWYFYRNYEFILWFKFIFGVWKKVLKHLTNQIKFYLQYECNLVYFLIEFGKFSDRFINWYHQLSLVSICKQDIKFKIYKSIWIIFIFKVSI